MIKKVSRLIGLIMLLIAIIFIIFAINNPQASFPWNNYITYPIYVIYLITIVILLIAPFKDRKWKRMIKKENIYKFLYAICVLLVVGFVIRLGMDYIKYDNVNNSAPFYIFIIERVVEFILPSIIVFLVGKVIKNKYSK